MNVLEQAKAIIRGFPIFKDRESIKKIAEIDHNYLEYNFNHFIDINEIKIENEENVPLGASKLMGNPHLPDEFEWPEGYYFYAQFNLSDLKAHNPLNILPPNGILSLFLNPLATDFKPISKKASKLFYFNKDLNNLKRRKYIEKKFLPLEGKYYYNDFVEKTYSLNFKPAFTFECENFNGKDPLVPIKLIKQLEKNLDISYVNNSISNIFGNPIFWQGEEEELIFTDNDWNVLKNGFPEKDKNRILFYQNSFKDGTIHFWLYKDQIKNLDFSTINTSFSG